MLKRGKQQETTGYWYPVYHGFPCKSGKQPLFLVRRAFSQPELPKEDVQNPAICQSRWKMEKKFSKGKTAQFIHLK